MSNDREAEERQRYYLRKSLDAYRAGQIAFGRLVEDIEAIADALPPDSFQEELRSRWWTLEQVYAVDVLDREYGDSLPTDAHALIEETLSSIDALLQQHRTSDHDDGNV